MNKRTRILATLVVTGLCTAYILWKINVGETLHVLAQRERLVLPRRGRDHGPLRLADGLALGAAAPRPRDPRAPLLARARVLRRVHGRPGAPDRGRRRRGADLRDGPPARGPGRTGRRLGAARARARRRGDAHARGRRLRARGRPLPDRALPLDRALLRARDDRPRRGALLPPRAARARARRRRSCGRSGSSGRSARATRASTPTATTPTCWPASSR